MMVGVGLVNGVATQLLVPNEVPVDAGKSQEALC